MSQADYATFRKKAHSIFEFLDKDKDGVLRLDELQKGFQALKIPLAKHDEFIKELHASAKTQISKEDFERYTESQYLKIRSLFDKLDT